MSELREITQVHPALKVVLGIAFPFFIAAFLGIIAYGWDEVLAATLDAWGMLSRLVAITAIVLAVWTASRHAGRKMFVWWLREEDAWRFPLAWVLLLFAVSAVGMISAYIQLYEGPAIIREDLRKNLDLVSEFRTTAAAALRVPEYDALEAEIEARKAALFKEIVHPLGGRQCGVGTGARAILSEIRRILPAVVELSGDNTHDCSETEKLGRLVGAYRLMIDNALRSRKEFLDSNVAEKRVLAEKLETQADALTANLHKLEGDLSDIDTFVDKYFKYRQMLPQIEAAEAEYAALYREMKGAAGRSLEKTPSMLHFSNSQRLSSPTSFFRSLYVRFAEGSNAARLAAVVAAAFGLDFLSAFAMSWGFRSRYLRVAEGGGDSCADIAGSNVNCIIPRRRGKRNGR